MDIKRYIMLLLGFSRVRVLGRGTPIEMLFVQYLNQHKASTGRSIKVEVWHFDYRWTAWGRWSR
jgi:hypothetical protein